MAMWKIWNCQTLHKSLEITNALIAVGMSHLRSLIHGGSLMQSMSHLVPGSLYVCLHFANAHEEHGAVSSTWSIFIDA